MGLKNGAKCGKSNYKQLNSNNNKANVEIITPMLQFKTVPESKQMKSSMAVIHLILMGGWMSGRGSLGALCGGCAKECTLMKWGQGSKEAHWSCRTFTHENILYPFTMNNNKMIIMLIIWQWCKHDTHARFTDRDSSRRCKQLPP